MTIRPPTLGRCCGRNVPLTSEPVVILQCPDNTDEHLLLATSPTWSSLYGINRSTRIPAEHSKRTPSLKPTFKRVYAMSAMRPFLRQSLIKRTLATPHSSLLTPVLPAKLPAALHLKSGESYFGQSFGSENSKFGETVFSTSITSCASSSTKQLVKLMHIPLSLLYCVASSLDFSPRYRLNDRPILSRPDSRLHLPDDR